MSGFIGYSNLQSVEISALTGRATAAEAAIAANKAAYDTKVAALDATDASLLSTINANKATYDTKVAQLDATDASNLAYAQGVNSDLVAHKTAYDTKMAQLDTTDASLQNTINANRSLFDATKAALEAEDIRIDTYAQSVNTDLQGHKAAYDAKMTALDGVDASLQSQIDANLTNFNATVADLEAEDQNLQNQITANLNTFDATVADLEAEDQNLQNQITANLSTFNATVAELEAADADLQDQITANLNAYNAKMALLDSKDGEQDGRLTAVENRVTAVETNISEAVSAAVTENMAGQTLEAIQTALSDANSSLTVALATKVAETVQFNTDAAQNAAIDSKVAQVEYDTKISSLDNVNQAWDSRFYAVEEFIRAMLATYTITKPDGNAYDYTGAKQNISPLVPFSVGGKVAVSSSAWGLVINLSAYGASVGQSIELPAFGIDALVSDASNNRLIVTIPDSRSGDSFVGTLPFYVNMLGQSGIVMASSQVTGAIFNNLASLPSFSYTSPQSYSRNVAISDLSPASIGGAVASYSVSPALPAGLSLNASTGVISGTPTSVTAEATYTVTGVNGAGSATANIAITVGEISAPNISYSSPQSYTKDTAISALSPNNTGGAVTSWSISPALPAGLSFNIGSGIITGTPTAAAAEATYTVTASNIGGSATAAVVITVTGPTASTPITVSVVNDKLYATINSISTITGALIFKYMYNESLRSTGSAYFVNPNTEEVQNLSMVNVTVGQTYEITDQVGGDNYISQYGNRGYGYAFGLYTASNDLLSNEFAY